MFDGGDAIAGAPVIPGKGALLRVRYGDAGAKTLTVNPNEDLWLAAFATAEATSGKKLFTNQAKGAKKFELTFRVENGDMDEGIVRLAACVLGRKGQSGEVSLTAHFSDGTETKLTASIGEGSAGTTFFNFASVPGEIIQSLAVDGSKFSGDYILVDDLGFITNGKVAANARPPAMTQTVLPAASKQPAASRPAATKNVTLKPVAERLANFVELMFRRPASTDEQARFRRLFEDVRKSGKSEADALRIAAQAVLSSPAFLFLREPARADAPKVRALDDFELASRLSYFLWASAPDAELLATAREGRLRDPPRSKRRRAACSAMRARAN